MIDSTTNSRFSNKQLIVIYTIISLVSLLIVWELADLPAHPCFFLRQVRFLQRFSEAL